MTTEQENSASSEFEKRLMIKTISGMDNLPMPSPRMIKILALLKGTLDTERIARAIDRTAELKDRIMSEVNSGVYGIDGTISSVEEAINTLGALNIKHILYSITVMPFFTSAEDEEWSHSYTSSILMTNMMNKLNVPCTSKLQLMMLLHDMGRLVLKRLNPKKYKQAVDISLQNNIPVHKAEEAIFHVNHAIAGGILMKKWGMSDDIAIPVAHHHSDFAPGREYIYDTTLMQICDWIDHSARKTPSAPPSEQMLRYSSLENLNFDFWTRYQQATIRIINNATENMAADENPDDWFSYEKIFVPVELPEKHQLKLQLLKKSEEKTMQPSLRRPIKNISASNIGDTSTHRFRRPIIKASSPVVDITESQMINRTLPPKTESEPTTTRVFGRPAKPQGTRETQVLRRPVARPPQDDDI